MSPCEFVRWLGLKSDCACCRQDIAGECLESLEITACFAGQLPAYNCQIVVAASENCHVTKGEERASFEIGLETPRRIRIEEGEIDTRNVPPSTGSGKFSLQLLSPKALVHRSFVCGLMGKREQQRSTCQRPTAND